MDTNQIYTLVNETAAQAMGSKAIAVVDLQSLISLGTNVLSSRENTEAFLNTLVQRIGRTIMSFRKYRNKLNGMVLNDFEYGAILQKISFALPEAEEDPAYNLVDGGTVDPWKINLPDVKQSLFVKRTPYMWTVTISRKLLKEAFLSNESMASFISYVFSVVRNAIEYSLENLGHMAVVNMISETPDGIRHVRLLNEYNAIYPDATPLTIETALVNNDFLRYAVRRILSTSDSLTDMSKLWNNGSIERFTPVDDQKILVLSSFQRALETVVQYSAFHEKMVELKNYQTVNYWQAATSPYKIATKRASDGTGVTHDNVIAVIYDRNALGTYRLEEDVATTPLNARGLYYNTCYHENQLWFNDLSENFVYFSLN